MIWERVMRCRRIDGANAMEQRVDGCRKSNMKSTITWVDFDSVEHWTCTVRCELKLVVYIFGCRRRAHPHEHNIEICFCFLLNFVFSFLRTRWKLWSIYMAFYQWKSTIPSFNMACSFCSKCYHKCLVNNIMSDVPFQSNHIIMHSTLAEYTINCFLTTAHWHVHWMEEEKKNLKIYSSIKRWQSEQIKKWNKRRIILDKNSASSV